MLSRLTPLLASLPAVKRTANTRGGLHAAHDHLREALAGARTHTGIYFAPGGGCVPRHVVGMTGYVECDSVLRISDHAAAARHLPMSGARLAGTAQLSGILNALRSLSGIDSQNCWPHPQRRSRPRHWLHKSALSAPLMLLSRRPRAQGQERSSAESLAALPHRWTASSRSQRPRLGAASPAVSATKSTEVDAECRCSAPPTAPRRGHGVLAFFRAVCQTPQTGLCTRDTSASSADCKHSDSVKRLEEAAPCGRLAWHAGGFLCARGD